jgi:hypothetical protein
LDAHFVDLCWRLRGSALVHQQRKTQGGRLDRR